MGSGLAAYAAPGMTTIDSNTLRLLADAEVAEDYVEQIFDVDGASDTAEAARARRRSSPRSSVRSAVSERLREDGGSSRAWRWRARVKTGASLR